MLQQYKTQGEVHVEYSQQAIDYQLGIEPLLEHLNSQRGALFASSFEYPGRYTCWDIGFVNPPLVIICKRNLIHLEALNKRGEVILSFFHSVLDSQEHLEICSETPL